MIKITKSLKKHILIDLKILGIMEIMQKRLKSRSWYSGYYHYTINTIGYKWVTLKAHGKNYKMPRDVWDSLIKTNRFRLEKA